MMKNKLLVSTVLMIASSAYAYDDQRIWIERQNSFECPPSECRVDASRLSGAYESSQDRVRIKGAADRLRSDGTQSDLGVLGRSPINEIMDFYWFFSFGFSANDAYTENLNRQAFAYEESDYEIGAGPVFNLGNLKFGGAVSVVTLRSARHRILGNGDRWDHHIEEVVLPRIELMVGSSGPRAGLSLSLKTFNKDSAEDRILDESGVEYIYDRERKLPAVISLSSHFTLSENLKLYSKIQRVLTSAGSDPSDVDRPLLKINSNGIGVGSTSGASRDRDYTIFEVSGKYQATPTAAMSGRFSVAEPRYNGVKNADWFQGNFGGKSLGIGASLGAGDLEGYFEVDYLLEEKLTHQASGVANDVWYSNSRDTLTSEKDGWRWRIGTSLKI